MTSIVNDYAGHWLAYFGPAVVQNTLFLAVLFLCLALLRKAPAQLRYNLALVGLAKLLLPPFIPAAMNNWFSSSSGGAYPEIGDLQTLTFPVFTASGPSLTWTGMLFLFWAGLAVFYVAMAGVSTWLLHSKVRGASSTGGFSLSRSVRLYLSAGIHSPLSVGIMPRRIFMPLFWRDLPAGQRQALLRHELAHIERHDGLVQSLQIFVQALYLFHPLVWLLNARLDEYREMVCDDVALRETKVSPQEYGRCLLHIAVSAMPFPWRRLSVSTLIGRKNKLLKRIHYLMQGRIERSPVKKAVLLFVLLGLLIAPLSLYSSKSGDDPLPSTSDKTGDARRPKVAYDVPPQPVGGPEAIQKKLHYLEKARRLGVEGRVYVNVFIDENGLVQKTEILKSLGSSGCDAAAVDAIKAVEWESARLKGRPVAAWDGVPVLFRLKKEPAETFSKKIHGSPPPKTSATPVAYDQPPQPVGGLRAIQNKRVYPAKAEKLGVEGKVIVNALIDENGRVKETEVLQSPGSSDYDKAAVAAVRAVEWKPALLDGKPVAARVGVPVYFPNPFRGPDIRVRVNSRDDITVNGQPASMTTLKDMLRQEFQKGKNTVGVDIADGLPRELAEEVMTILNQLQSELKRERP